MNCVCTNLRNRKYVLKENKGTGVWLNDEPILVTKFFYDPCTLTKEHFNVVAVLSEEYKKKTHLFLDSSWFKVHDDDATAVEQLNESMLEMLKSTGCELEELTAKFEGRLDGTYDMNTVYLTKHCLVSPYAKKVVPLAPVKAVFYERMGSYQKNFDLALCGDSVYHIYAVNRKLYYNVLKAFFSIEQYEGGADPLPWPTMMKEKKKGSWEAVAAMFTGVEEEEEDDCSEWSESQEEEDDDDDFDDCVDFEESEYESEASEASEASDDRKRGYETDETDVVTKKQKL